MGEWVQFVFVLLLALTAWFRPLELARRLRVTLLALLATAAIAAARFSERWISPSASSVLRDWLPAALMLVPYWQVGHFFNVPDPAMEARLANLDRIFFDRLGIPPSGIPITSGLATFFQLSYVIVYLLVPAGLVVLYTTGLRREVDFYWLVVLPATYICFGLTLFVRALPPIMLRESQIFRLPPTRIGALNRSILDRAGIHAVTCPSGHVASSLAVALVLLRLQPWAGAVFLWVAISVAAATIVGGYHYVADVLLAGAITILVFAATFCIQP